MDSPHSANGYFVSDLHLFSRRSTAGQFLAELKQKVRHSHTIVLGGDIFDFKWSTHSTELESLDNATLWIDDLISENEACEFHFILGNHDAHDDFVARLEQLAQRHPRFFWHRYFARLDHCLFLHGDVADGALDHERLDSRRARLEQKRRRARIWHVAYDFAIHARLHRLAMFSIREMVVLRRISEYAEKVGHGPAHGVTDVYFGHIHLDLDGVQYHGLRFHNGGAAIRGLSFRIVETTLTRPAHVRA